MTDILKAMQKLANEGSCVSLINDDNGNWAFAEEGVQNIRGKKKDDLSTVFFIKAKMFKPTIEQAWKVYWKWRKEQK